MSPRQDEPSLDGRRLPIGSRFRPRTHNGTPTFGNFLTVFPKWPRERRSAQWPPYAPASERVELLSYVFDEFAVTGCDLRRMGQDSHQRKGEVGALHMTDVALCLLVAALDAPHPRDVLLQGIELVRGLAGVSIAGQPLARYGCGDVDEMRRERIAPCLRRSRPRSNKVQISCPARATRRRPASRSPGDRRGCRSASG